MLSTPSYSFPWLTRIVEVIVRDGPCPCTYESDSYGYGSLTLTDAIEGAHRTCAAFAYRTGREHRAYLDLFCDTCKGHGIKPGCKRKRCPTCHGRGSLPIPVVAPHAAP